MTTCLTLCIRFRQLTRWLRYSPDGRADVWERSANTWRARRREKIMTAPQLEGPMFDWMLAKPARAWDCISVALLE